jgi:nucleotide-binding universal stress UspA family protein
MTNIPLPQAWLVAVDFSPYSLRALETALSWRSPDAELTVLHVVDTEFARDVERVGIGSRADAIATMRRRAESDLASLLKEKAAERVESMIVEGIPFAEIIKISNDLDCDLVVLGSHGASGLTQILFGSTAEKVLRAARRPVLCVP